MSNKILAFAGSLRKDSFNKAVIKYVVKILSEHKMDTTEIDIANYPMPIYDGDIEINQGIPENAMAFRELMQKHNIFILSCPEYNSSISGVLKNIIDWCSRPIAGEKPLICFQGKYVVLISASPGVLGGIRGLFHIRNIFHELGSIVLPYDLSLSEIDKLLLDPKNLNKKLHCTLDKLINFLSH